MTMTGTAQELLMALYKRYPALAGLPAAQAADVLSSQIEAACVAAGVDLDEDTPARRADRGLGRSYPRWVVARLPSTLVRRLRREINGYWVAWRLAAAEEETDLCLRRQHLRQAVETATGDWHKVDWPDWQRWAAHREIIVA